ncbi:MAG: protein phosphatase 2C domain-containing protein [Anaerolineae bacterium]|nr:protein phosphatase 2C domain-containing protein [Anaerolineae bacterium]
MQQAQIIKTTTTLHWLPKTGNSAAEYEDAYHPLFGGEYTGEHLRFAVADGASEGMLSGQWAKILVSEYCQTDAPTVDMPALLERCHPVWQKWLKHYLQHRDYQGKPIQWFEEPGFEKGAFSTLLGLHLHTHEGKGQWEAVAVGDSCLFQIRHNHLLGGFPLKKSEEFDSRPYLIASNPVNNKNLPDHVRKIRGKWRPGDQFFLITDALAYWFWSEIEAGNPAWQILLDITHQNSDSLADWLQALKNEKQIRNDDVTLVIVEML